MTSFVAMEETCVTLPKNKNTEFTKCYFYVFFICIIRDFHISNYDRNALCVLYRPSYSNLGFGRQDLSYVHFKIQILILIQLVSTGKL